MESPRRECPVRRESLFFERTNVPEHDAPRLAVKTTMRANVSTNPKKRSFGQRPTRAPSFVGLRPDFA